MSPRLILPVYEDGAVAIATAQTTLPYPPTEHGAVDSWAKSYGTVGEFDLAIWAAATTNLSLAELFACVLHSGVIADDDVDTVDFANNELDITGHGLVTGDGPIQFTTTDTLPTGLALATDYWVIYLSANTIKLATSLATALVPVAVAFTDVGVGTHTLADTTDTLRMHYQSMGLLGDALDGYIPLTANRARVSRISHTPASYAYAVKATLSAAEAVSIAMYPVVGV